MNRPISPAELKDWANKTWKECQDEAWKEGGEMNLDGNIRHLLDKGRLSVARLANIVGMHQPTLFRILGHPDKKPRTKTIKPIADLLGVSTTDLLYTDLKAQIENVITKNPFGFNNKITQPKQAPVVHTLNCVCGAVWDVRSDVVEEMVHAPTPPQRKPLTDEELDVLAMDSDGTPNSHLEFARAIEAAHGIKP